MMNSIVRASATLLLAAALCLHGAPASAEETATVTSADLAAKLGAAVQDGNSVTRVKFTVRPSPGAEPSVTQVQIKARRTADKSEVAYHVLWPADRKSESFALKQTRGGAASGQLLASAGQASRLDRGRMLDAALGSDLAYADTIENFFLWPKHSLAGNETVGNTNCVIIESRPGDSDASPYGKVRSWIDTRKMAVMRVEKFDRSGRLLRRIETTQVAKDDIGRNIPAAMTVQRAGSASVTEIDGANIRHDAPVTDADFTAEGAR